MAEQTDDTRKVVVVGGTSGSLLPYRSLVEDVAELVLAKLKAQPIPADPQPDTPPPVTEPDSEWKPDGEPVDGDAGATNPDGKPGALKRVKPVSRMSKKPWGYNRLQAESDPARDDWEFKESEDALRNAPGFPDETPALLTRHGRTMFDARMFYGDDGRAPWGLPDKDTPLFYEITGGDLEPYRSPFDVLTTSMETLGANLFKRLPQWNTSEENGLIDGVATVVEAHINAEYAWFEQSEWDKLNLLQRNALFYNYHIGRAETLQLCYLRGGIDALKEALHQKWRNYFGLIIRINNYLSPGCNTYYGDHSGIAPIYSIKDVAKPANTQSEEICNAGIVRVNGIDFDVSGNLRAMSGVAHLYNYEDYVTMSVADYNAYRTTDNHNINDWHGNMKPDLFRPYDFVQHALETIATKKRKDWPDFRTYIQTEPIYENHIKFPEDNWREVGAWVPWTGDTCKIPLHPEVAANLVTLARFLYEGLFVWGKNRRQDLPAGISENSHPELHNTGREGLQVGYDTVSQIDAFGPNKRILTGQIPVWNPLTSTYVTTDAAGLLLANGDVSKCLPLVIGVYDPDSGEEAYALYYPNEKRDGKTDVRFKSPITGEELSGTAEGWAFAPYVRTNVKETV